MRWAVLILVCSIAPVGAKADDAPPAEASEEAALPPDTLELGPNGAPEALLAFAAAREAEGNGGLAIESLERFLESFPFDPKVPEVTARLAELRKAKARVTISSPHVSASVWLGGSKIASRTPAEVELPAGRHRLVVTARDGRSKVFALVLPPASRRVIDVTFAGDIDPLAQGRFGVGEPLLVEAPKEEAPADADSRRSRRRVLALAGVSTSALVFTGVFGMMALSDAEEFRRDPSEPVARSGERAAILADVSLGVALVSGVTALALRLRDRAKKPAAVTVAPTVGARAAGLVLRGGL